MKDGTDTMHCTDASGQRGFTLIELMLAVAVLSILVGIGVPAYNDTIRNNQISATGADLITALTLARNEAMKRSLRVSVCASANQTSCAASTDWSNGWIVFSDDFGTAGVIEPGDTPIQVWSAPPGGVRITAGDNRAVSFTARARLQTAQKFTVTKKGCSANQQRQIDVSLAGRIGLTRQACTAS